MEKHTCDFCDNDCSNCYDDHHFCDNCFFELVITREEKPLNYYQSMSATYNA